MEAEAELLRQQEQAAAAEVERKRVAETRRKAREVERKERKRLAEAAKAKRLEEEERARKEKERQEQLAKRRNYWMGKIDLENRTVERLVLLLATEFCRTHSCNRSDLLKDPEAKEKLQDQAKDTFRELYEQVECRVVVKDSGQDRLDGRVGIALHWDDSKGKLRVGLESKKKGKNLQHVYILPDHVEILATKMSYKKKRQKHAVSLAFIASLYEDASLIFEVEKSLVDELMAQSSTEKFLHAYCETKDKEEAIAEQREAKQRIAEEAEERKRRAERIRREKEEWERQRAEYEERKERLKRMQQQRKEKQEKRKKKQTRAEAASARGADEQDGDEHFRGRCQCSGCRLEREYAERFFEDFFGRRSRARRGASFGFQAGGGFFFFSNSDDDSEDDARWDDEFNRRHEQEHMEKNSKAAACLGVDENASEDEINKAFRKLSLKYHPDKFRPELHKNGMTKDDAEEHFKKLSDARDEMLLFRERNE
uniref:J domain-containing protein n=2 Tax=Grammatophora oceanica TaxID=210454 RepID=A0A7S1YH59_9STRA